MSAPDKERGRRGAGDLVRKAPSLYTPSAVVSYEDALRVWNADLAALSPSQLENEAFLAARITARDPRGCIWRGMTPITRQTWADERIRIIHSLLMPAPTPPPRRKPTSSSRASWI